MYTFPFVPFRYSKTATAGILILTACLIPSSEFSKLNVQVTFADIIVHCIMFMVFSAALYWDISKRRPILKNGFKTICITMLISTVFGIITELLQHYITILNRSGSITDLLFDLMGAALGIGLTALLIKRRSVPAPGYH